MNKISPVRRALPLAAALLAGGAAAALTGAEAKRSQATAVDLSRLRAIDRVDERFQSYNVEAVEVTGGNFWAPYSNLGGAPKKAVPGPHGVEFASGAYQHRDPIDLSSERLRMLTRALGPAYMRVSGSWANSIYFQDDDKPAAAPPPGYQGVLTRAQWAGVVAFAKAVDAKILTSFAISDGARTSQGAWNPEQARRLFAFTNKIGGRIDAVELANEPNASRITYKAEDFARDNAALDTLLSTVSPGTKLVGPGSTGEAGFKLFPKPREEMSTARLLAGTPAPRFDVFSHHFYGAVSQRCASLARGGPAVTTSPDDALSEEWLSRADQAQTYYRGMRDRFAPGKPIWITETAQSACGGDPWSSTFLDTFRYVDQLGRFARNDVSMIFHNTLAASDYALIDDVTWLPRPNYWAALLWRRLMGEVVLGTGGALGSLHVYAQCLRDHPGGVALVAINLDRKSAARLTLPFAAERYTLSADALEARSVKLNGRTLALAQDGTLPELRWAAVPRGPLTLAPATISFLAMPTANNADCR